MPGSCAGILRARYKRRPEEQLQDDLPVGSARWAGRGSPQFRNSTWGSACTAATDVREGRKGKLFALNFHKHIRELCRHPICTVWHVISAGSKCKTFLRCLRLHTHVETRHLHQWKGLLDTRRKISGSGLFKAYSELLLWFSRKRVWKVRFAFSHLTILLCKGVHICSLNLASAVFGQLCQRIGSGQQSYR